MPLMIAALTLFASIVACNGVIDPVACPASEKEDELSFPLPLSLEIGDRWTYSVVTTLWKAELRSLDTLSIENLTIRVVERLRIEDQTYFVLSDGGIYRIDEASRTRRYNTETKCEKIVWDIWGPVRGSGPGLAQRTSIEKTVINGYPCEDGCLSRYGPFVQNGTPDPEYLEYYLEERWYFQTLWKANTEYREYDLGDVLDYPYNLTYADILKYPDWGIIELYLFQDTPEATEFTPIRTFVVAPNVGSVYYAKNTSFVFGSGKIGRSYYHPTEKQKTEWILRDFQKGAPASP